MNPYICIKCGNEASNVHDRYFVIPGPWIVPNCYSLCEAHKDLRFDFEDFYDENGKRKKTENIHG